MYMISADVQFFSMHAPAGSFYKNTTQRRPRAGKKKQAGIDDDSVNAVLELRRPFVQRVVTLKAGLYSVYFAGHVCHIYESD